MRFIAVTLGSSLVVLTACGKDASPQAKPPPPAVAGAAAAVATHDAAAAPTDCAAVPAAVAGHAIAELDLDGDGMKDRLVPTACDGDGTCTWAVFTIAAGCPRALGTIAEVDRIEALPVTVDGRAAVRTLAVSPYYRTEAMLAWSGDAWRHVFDTQCAPDPANGWWCEATHESLSSGEPAPPVPCVVAPAGATPTLDLDRDGSPETLIAVDCGADWQSVCGSLVLRSHDGCTRPLGFLPRGEVVIPDDLKPKAPARIRVQRPDEAGTEEQIDLGIRLDREGFEVLGTRTCDRRTCTRFTPPDRGAETP